jgi:hypothetical protein
MQFPSRLSAALDAWMARQGDQGMATERQALTRQGPSDTQPRAGKAAKKKAKL